MSGIQVTLNWKDNGNEDGFNVERSPDGSTGWAQIATPAIDVVSYIDNDVALQPDTTYYYRVRAHRSGLFSAYTNIAAVHTTIDPLSLAHLEVYYDADHDFSGATDGTAESTWLDLSGNSRNLTATSSFKPLAYTSAGHRSPNGLALLHFDGIDDFMGSPAIATWPTFARGYSFWFYGRLKQVTAPPGPFAYGNLFTDSATDANPQIFYEGVPSAPPGTRTQSGTVTLDSGTIFGPWQFFAVVYDTGNKAQAYRATLNNPVAALNQNPSISIIPANSNGSSIRFSGNNGGNGCILADMANWGWVSDTLSLTTLKGMRAFLANKYGEE